MKQTKSAFKGRHFEPSLTLSCVRWYCGYQLSYRDLEEMMRGAASPWITRPSGDGSRDTRRRSIKRTHPHLRVGGASYRLDETCVKVGTEWKYLYRAVDPTGRTIESMLGAKRDVPAAERFFRKMMRAEHRRLPFLISVDKNAAYPEAFAPPQVDQTLPLNCELRRVKYLNNVIEQDHRFVKKKARASQCFERFHAAEPTLEGIEALHMMRKGQIKRLDGRDAVGQAKFVASLFGVAA